MNEMNKKKEKYGFRLAAAQMYNSYENGKK